MPGQGCGGDLSAVRVPRGALRDREPCSRRSRAGRCGRSAAAGWLAGAVAGALLGAGYALQTAGLERRRSRSTGFDHRDVRRVDAAPRARALPDADRRAAWGGVALATVGLALPAGRARRLARRRPARARAALPSTRSRSS